MFILKHINTLQHVSIIIQIIFRELVCFLLKSLILKFVKNVKSQCGDAAAYQLVCVRASCVERYAGLQSNAPTYFDHHSDHLQGTRMFLVKVTDFKIC